jgi:hypothetical protein
VNDLTGAIRLNRQPVVALLRSSFLSTLQRSRSLKRQSDTGHRLLVPATPRAISKSIRLLGQTLWAPGGS